MTSQIQFFCSPREEVEILQYLLKNGGTKVFNVINGGMNSWSFFSTEDLPDWTSSLEIYLWQHSHGPLVWHTSRPEVKGSTHKSLVNNLFSRQEWDNRNLTQNDKMLDSDLSPILYFNRGKILDGRVCPHTIIFPPSSLRRVGIDYERWANRSLGWIRRKCKSIHDWRNQSKTIYNPYSSLNTIYAFPDMLKDFTINPNKYAID